MRETQIWKYLDRHFGSAIRRHAKSESGVAMIMALLFTVMAELTLVVITSVLVGQAIPYKNNKQQEQSFYAAETGLEMGLSFLRTAESKTAAEGTATSYSSFFPQSSSSSATRVGGRSDDGINRYFVTSEGAVILDCVNAAHSDYIVSKVQRGTDYPSCSTIYGDLPSATGTTGTTAIQDYSTSDTTLRIEITYWNTDPTTITDESGNPDSSKKISSPANFKKARYAIVTAKAYNGKRWDTVNKNTVTAYPTTVLQGIYKFGVTQVSNTTTTGTATNGSSDGAFLMQANEMLNEYPWVQVAAGSVTPDANGDVATLKGTNVRGSLTAGQNYIDNPVNETCLVATNPSNPADISIPADGVTDWIVRVYPRATSTNATADNGIQTYTYTEQCKAHGSYNKVNAWTYGEDDTIRLSGTTFCLTGKPYDKNKNATDNKGLAKLEPCGTSYSPNSYVNGSSNGKKVDLANDEYGYDATAEKTDPNSALNKLQKWAFYFGFINAAWWDIPSNSYMGGGTVHQNNTAFQTLNYYKGTADDSKVGTGWSGANLGASCGTGSTDACYLSAYWATNLTSNGHYEQPEKTFLESLGHGGEAGYETEQVVGQSGTCMQVRDEGSNTGNGTTWGTRNVVTKQCYVNVAPLNPFCYQRTIGGKANDSNYKSGTGNTVCGTNTDSVVKTDTKDGIADTSTVSINGTKADYITYDRPSDTVTIDGTATKTPVYAVQLSSTMGCLRVTSTDDNGILQYSGTSCSTAASGSDSANYTFVRTENLGKNSSGGTSKFNYKFVLMSSLDTDTQNAVNSKNYSSAVNLLKDESKNPNALCLQEVTPGTSLYQYGKNGLVNSSNSEANVADMFPYVQLQSCAATTGSGLGAVDATPQQWNAPTALQGRYTNTSSGSFSTSTSTTLQTSSKGFSMVRQYNLQRLCNASGSTDPRGKSCWVA